MTSQSEDILGYAVHAGGMCCIQEVVSAIGSTKTPRWLACINPHSYVIALRDPCFAVALRAADWLIPDGAGIVLASRLLRGSIRERVTGSDVFREVQKELNRRRGYSVFFLGSTPETLSAMEKKLAKDFPFVKLAGTYSPPFKTRYTDEENDAMVAAVNAVRPDVLWVGMTAPKQEKWIFDNRVRLDVKFVGAIGAVFDFYSGRVRRSHPAFQRIGLEWLPRLLQEPRRLWRRMFISAPIFLWHVIRCRLLAK